jgi:dihydrofolate reductase
MKVSIIVSMSRNNVIGKDGNLPWNIPEDLKWFKRKTTGHSIIMGRKTFESIGRVLPSRKNIIISRRSNFEVQGADIFYSIEDALNELRDRGEDEVFIIGGAQIFEVSLPYTDRIYLTLIHGEFDGDTFFPAIPEGEFEEVYSEYHSGAIPFTITILERPSSS